MAHSRTAKKNIRKSEKRRIHNRALNSAMRTEVKKVRNAIENGNRDEALAAFPKAQKLLDKAAKTNRMHHRRAARLKSCLALAIGKLS